MPIIYVFFPETKGLQLEAVDRLFAGEDLAEVQYDEKTPEETTAEEVESPSLDA